jgi:O-antigen/teichoic acid export membrane protein
MRRRYHRIPAEPDKIRVTLTWVVGMTMALPDQGSDRMRMVKDTLQSLWNKRKDPSFQSVVKLILGTGIGQMALVLSTPVVARLYTPADVGLLGLCVSFMSIAALALSLGYENAIVSVRKDEEPAFLSLTFVLLLPLSVVGAVVFLGMIHFDVLSYGILPSWAPVAMFLLLVMSGLFSILRFWSVKQKDFGGISKALIYQGAIRAVVPIAWSLPFTGWVGLLAGEILGRVSGIRKMFPVAWRRIRDLSRVGILHSLSSVARKYWKYPAVVLPSGLIDTLGSNLPTPLISSFFGIEQAGIFLLVTRISAAPVALVGASIGDVFHSRVAEAYLHNRAAVHSTFWKTGSTLFMISLAIYLPFALLAPLLVVPVLGPQWTEVGMLILIFAPQEISRMTASPLTRMFYVANRPELKMVSDFGRTVLTIAGLFVLHAASLDFRSCMVGLMIFNLAGYLLHFFLLERAARGATTSSGMAGN